MIDEYAKSTGRTLLRLPPYHCDLNPIELAWAVVKGHVKANNTTFHLADVKQLLIQGVEKAASEMCNQVIGDMQDNAQHPSPNESDPDHKGAHLGLAPNPDSG